MGKRTDWHMILGILQFDLFIHDACSLKDKRSVVNSLKTKLRREHNISVAEVGAQDKWNVASLAVTLVATDAQQASSIIDAVVRKLDALHDAQLGLLQRDIITADALVSMHESSDTLWTEQERRDVQP